MLKTSEEKIRELQRKLYQKAKLEPKYRFYSLYDKVYRSDILSHAYQKVKANRGAPGVDGVSFGELEADEGKGAKAMLAELERELKEKKYRPQAVRRVMIPKPNGDLRPLGIPTIRDRVAQMAVKIVIEPIFEADFQDHSYGYRPKRRAHDAMGDITHHLIRGYTEVIDADLSKYFDSIPHDKLMRVVAERIVDREILHLMKSWLKAPVVEDRDGKSKTGGGKRSTRGTPQGGVISPLLSNLYLNLLDRIWVRKEHQKRYGARLIRYADDLVILCRKGTDGAFGELRRILERLNLDLNEKKTRVLDANREGFKFLGFRIQKVVSGRTGKRYPLVRVSGEAMGRIREKVRKLTSRERTILPLEQVMEKLNETIEGWSNYFHYGHTSPDLSNMRGFVEERFRGHLCRRYKVRGQGYRRFPWKLLYEMGLYKIPKTPAWRVPAHAL